MVQNFPGVAFSQAWVSRYGIEGEIYRPLNHMRQIPRLIPAPDRIVITICYTSQLKYVFWLEENVSRVIGQNFMTP